MTHKTTPLPPPRYLYLSLSPVLQPSSTSTQQRTKAVPALDETTLRLHLLTALSTYLGDHGAAIPVDILSVRGPSSQDARADAEMNRSAMNAEETIVRVPRADGAAFMAAVASWGGSASASSSGVSGYVVTTKGEWLADVVGGGGPPDSLFDFGAGSGPDDGDEDIDRET